MGSYLNNFLDPHIIYVSLFTTMRCRSGFEGQQLYTFTTFDGFIACERSKNYILDVYEITGKKNRISR